MYVHFLINRWVCVRSICLTGVWVFGFLFDSQFGIKALGGCVLLWGREWIYIDHLSGRWETNVIPHHWVWEVVRLWLKPILWVSFFGVVVAWSAWRFPWCCSRERKLVRVCWSIAPLGPNNSNHYCEEPPKFMWNLVSVHVREVVISHHWLDKWETTMHNIYWKERHCTKICFCMAIECHCYKICCGDVWRNQVA